MPRFGTRAESIAKWWEGKAQVVREEGVAFPLVAAVLRALARASLSRWLNKHAQKRWHRKDGKAPPWVSELYVVFATALIVMASLMPPPNGFYSYIGLFILGYINAELARTLLAWVLTERHEPVHGLGRSFILFATNAIQIAISAAGAERLLGCGDMTVTGTWGHVVAIVSLDGSTADACQPVVAALRFCLGSLLILITLAALVGGFAREELRRSPGK